MHVLFCQVSNGLINILTVAPHPHGEALLKPTILATIAMMLGHFTVLVATTLVSQLFANRTLEEAFAPFATDCSIVAA